MRSSRYGFAAQAVALAATFGLSLSGPHRAGAQATVSPVAQNDGSPVVSILSPVPRTSFSGIKPVEISAFYQGSSTNQIAVIELYVDGVKAAQKVLDAPETRGVVSFLVDAGALSAGTHRIVVRASAADAEVVSAKSSFIYEAPTPEKPTLEPSLTPSQGSPLLSIENPAVAGQVQGRVTLRIKAEDPSGKPPYVSLFIDHGFKTLRNYAPYEFTWDTTTYPNGYHTIEAFGYNDSQDVGHAQPIRVFVNNPGGRTERRTDLLDAPKARPHAAKPLAKVHVTPDIAAVPVLKATDAKTATAVRTAKASPVRRRPTAAALAAPAPSANGQGQKLAKLPKLDFSALALSTLPGLSDPFTADTVRPKTVTPTSGFKPLLPGMRVTKTPATALVVTPATPRAHGAQELIVTATALPKASFSTSFLTSPTLPNLGAAVRTLRVSMPMPQRAQGVAVHASHRSYSVNWLRATGAKSILFNSTRLPLERPLTAEGSVMFGPLRQIFQAGGGSLMWQARTGVVTARTGRKDIALTMGSKTATVNQVPVALDGAPYINNGRTMIPLSFLQTALDVSVQFDPATGHLLVNSK